MSVSIKYKGTEIASASTEVTKTIKTAGKYCEADILVENTPDSGADPVINPLSVTANGTYTAPSGVDGYSPINVNVPQGITPTGNINITDTNVTDVTNYATAQVVDADLVASNIKEGVNILGILGTFAGGGGSLPSSISKIDGGSFTVAADTTCPTYRITHSLGAIPKGVYIWCDAFTENTSYTVDRLMSWFMGFIDYTNDGTTYRHGEYMQFHRTAGGTAYVDSSYFNYALERFATTSDFCAYNPNVSYVSGITYNWVAWV